MPSCPPRRMARNQIFWVTIRVKRPIGAGSIVAAFGCRRLAASRQRARRAARAELLASDERSLTAFGPLWKAHLVKHYGAEKTAQLWPTYLDDLAAHRLGALHPEASPVAKWDEQGALTHIDFTAFDRAMESSLPATG